MKILTLIIAKKWFDAILSGEKTVETREVKPSNTKYISYRDNNTGVIYRKDADVPDAAWESSKGVDIVINQYDAIQFWVGYAADRPGALVEVKGAELIDVLDEETGEPIRYEYNDYEYQMTEIDYYLGEIISKTNC
ncbi:MAG: ASCH domain-containing protein [Alistipes sp.]|nr:ASCH domain-containing protein [Alistipes sp.]